MKCPTCQANMAHVTESGEPMVRNHGLVFKKHGGVALVCPRCKGDVDMSRDLAKALQSRMILVFK